MARTKPGSRPPRAPAVGTVDFGDLGGTEPISRAFGGDRGTPLDRYYIEGFLARHRQDIRGRVLEIGENVYTRRFGGDAVTRSDILDAPEARNPEATIVADLARASDIRSGSFDCIILTQTLHMIYDVRGVLATVHRLLAPGGVVLATIPGISQIDRVGLDSWFWYMTPRCAESFFGERFAPADVSVEQHGNVLAATALLQGIALEELDRAALDRADPFYPVITGVRAAKPARARVRRA